MPSGFFKKSNYDATVMPERKQISLSFLGEFIFDCSQIIRLGQL